MTHRYVFVGELSDGPDPLDWGGDPSLGNLPKGWSPDFPSVAPLEPWGRVVTMIEGGETPGKRVDWGAWAGRASKAQLLNLIEETYGKGESLGLPPYRYELFQDLLAYVSALSDDKEYALVACED